MSEIKLGCKAKDTITGFTGIVTSITEWLNGCRRVGIQPQELKDGSIVKEHVFDIEQLEYIDHGVNKQPILERITDAVKRTGGDRESIERAADPR